MPVASRPRKARGLLIESAVRESVEILTTNLGAPPSPARVHDLRVAAKRLRALLALAAPVLSARSLRQADSDARSIKNAFAAEREREVMSGLFLEFADTGDDPLPPGEAVPIPDPRPLLRTAASLSKRIAQVPFERLSDGDVAAMWLDSYRDARRCLRVCEHGPASAHVMHRWRKRTKALLYQSAIFRAHPPARTLAFALEKLASTLGRHHDLDLLRRTLEASDPGHSLLPVLRKSVAETADRALAQGRRAFGFKKSELRKGLT